ncbi:tRNA (adenosine(37)-N6)-threonylcarbamoyltransferase complex ATPase subunit type 1 TsaE [Candidatus Uhrbacteria bacterium]|nr:tRNA (adenosine(37)-N6)-threonylcarbamoyltransferase complex ATPase subunit type 1 TsaE [Candidatus Uhrbacteria bacterium]
MRNIKISSKGKTTAVKVPSENDWGLVVEKLLPLIRPGTILAVQGNLGAGKTTFIQALAKALGIKRFVPSPTFALMRSYKLPKTVNGIHRLVHVDAYRLKDELELQVLDLDEELSDGKSLLVVEWPEKIEKWIAARESRVIRLKIV